MSIIDNQHPSAQSSNQLWEMAIGLNLPEGANYVRDKGVGFVEITPSIDYPDSLITKLSNSTQILLEPVSSSDETTLRKYILPTDSSTLAAILNEAAGATDSFEVMPDKSRTVALLRELFSSITERLAYIKNTDGAVPDSLSYSQLLIQKNSGATKVDFKILPPFSFLYPTKDLRSAWLHAGRTLLQSMDSGSDNDSQRRLVDSLRENIGADFLKES